MSKLHSSRKRQNGQGMTEYIIIVALIAIAAIGVFTFFGGAIRNQVAGMAGELAGTGSDAQRGAAATQAAGAAAEGAREKGLDSYDN